MLNMVLQIIASLPDETSADAWSLWRSVRSFPTACAPAPQSALSRKTSEHAQRLARRLKYGLTEEQKAPEKASALKRRFAADFRR